MQPRLLALLALVAAAAAGGRSRHEFRGGEFVPTARRVQYHGLRTHWVDLTGRHCPRFGDDATLALPLPPPALPDGASLRGTYKVQLAFDGERLRTPWLTVAGRATPGAVPVIRVTLTRAGRRLVSARAAVGDAPPDYVAAHPALAGEWAPAAPWPRHAPLLVEWAAAPGADLVAGAYAVLAACLAAALAGAVTGLAGVESAVADLVAGVAARADASLATAAAAAPALALPPHAVRPVTPTAAAAAAAAARTAPLYGGGGVRPVSGGRAAAAPPPPQQQLYAPPLYGGGGPPPPQAPLYGGGVAKRD